jgi:hypothetical protein
LTKNYHLSHWVLTTLDPDVKTCLNLPWSSCISQIGTVHVMCAYWILVRALERKVVLVRPRHR